MLVQQENMQRQLNQRKQELGLEDKVLQENNLLQVENVGTSEEDVSLDDMEAATALTKDDHDFHINMSGKGRKNSRRGRGKRGTYQSPLVKLEVKEEEEAEDILGLSPVNTSEVFQNNGTFGLLGAKRTANNSSSVKKSPQNSSIIPNTDETTVEDPSKDTDMLIVENMLGVDDVMEVDVLDISGLHLPSLQSHAQHLVLPPHSSVPATNFAQPQTTHQQFQQDLSQQTNDENNIIEEPDNTTSSDKDSKDTTTDGETFSCEYCQKVFTSKMQVVDHQIDQHISDNALVPYVCRYVKNINCILIVFKFIILYIKKFLKYNF